MQRTKNIQRFGRGKLRLQASEPGYAQAVQKRTSPHSAVVVYLDTLSPTGRRSVESVLSTATKLLGGGQDIRRYPWHALSFEDLQGLKSTMMERGYAPRTVNMTITAVRSVVRMAFQLGLTTSGHVLQLSAIKPVRVSGAPSGRALTKGEIQQLLSTSSRLSHGSIAGIRNRALLLAALTGGLRVSELVAIDREDIDVTAGKLHIPAGKGHKFRVVHMPSYTARALQRWIMKAKIEEGRLWRRISRAGNVLALPLSVSGTTYVFRQLAAMADVPYFSPHDLRRTYITRLLEQGVDLNTVRKMAGHSDISTTVSYDRRGEGELRRIGRAIKISECAYSYEKMAASA